MVLGCALPAHHSLVEYSCPPCRLQVCFVLFCSAISGKLGSKQHDQASGKTAWCYRNSALFNFLLYLVESDLLPVLSVEASRSLPLEACAHYDHESCISHAPKICNAIRNLQAQCTFPIFLAYSCVSDRALHFESQLLLLGLDTSLQHRLCFFNNLSECRSPLGGSRSVICAPRTKVTEAMQDVLEDLVALCEQCDLQFEETSIMELSMWYSISMYGPSFGCRTFSLKMLARA